MVATRPLRVRRRQRACRKLARLSVARTWAAGTDWPYARSVRTGHSERTVLPGHGSGAVGSGIHRGPRPPAPRARPRDACRHAAAAASRRLGWRRERRFWRGIAVWLDRAGNAAHVRPRNRHQYRSTHGPLVALGTASEAASARMSARARVRPRSSMKRPGRTPAYGPTSRRRVTVC